MTSPARAYQRGPRLQRRTFLLAGWLLSGGCASSPVVEPVDAVGLRSCFDQSLGGALALFVWAEWSRRSVALLPSFLELTREYEAAGVSFLTIGVDSDRQSAERMFASNSGAARHLLWSDDLDSLGLLLGPAEPPAALFYDPSGELRLLLDDSDPVNPLRPEALAAAIETAAASSW